MVEVRKFVVSNKKVIVLIIILAVITALGILIYIDYTPKCLSYDCFQSKMKTCSPIIYTNEQSEATWKYEILGLSNRDCKVLVTLMQAKQGELGIEKFEKLSMECSYPYGIAAYPEKNLDLCHGRLKEELQGLIIEKLHTYIIGSLGQYNESLRRVT